MAVVAPPVVMSASASWPAMGTTATVLLNGSDPSCGLDLARRTMRQLEDRWSRFLPGSDVARINAAQGRTVPVDAATATLVADAVAWWQRTGGRFDPTVLAAVRDAGYVRTFAAGPGPIGTGARVPGCAGIEVDRGATTVCLPRGVGLDLGGIGKGRAVDLVSGALAAYDGGLVDLGGDLRVWGTAPNRTTGWPIAVEDPRTATPVALLGLHVGAVATSTTLRRRWQVGGRTAHHLIDPATGRPVDGELVSVTVVAGLTTGAEVLAKAAVVSGSIETARRLLDEHDVAALLVPEVGHPVPVGGFTDLCWAGPEGA